MPVIDFSQDDLLRGKLVTPGWYVVELGAFTQKLAKSGESNNYIFEDSKIVKNAETGSEEFAGVPLNILFSGHPKAKGFMVGFFSALGADIKPGSRLNLENAAGKQIEVFVDNDIYEGRTVNRINHQYRAVGAV